MDIDIDTPRGWSKPSSPKSSRELSVHSDASSMDYAERVRILANNPTWADQVENENLQSPLLSYATAKEGTS